MIDFLPNQWCGSLRLRYVCCSFTSCGSC